MARGTGEEATGSALRGAAARGPRKFDRGSMVSSRFTRGLAVGLCSAAAAFCAGCGNSDTQKVCVNRQHKVVQDQNCQHLQSSHPAGHAILPYYWVYGSRFSQQGGASYARGGTYVAPDDPAAVSHADSSFGVSDASAGDGAHGGASEGGAHGGFGGE